MNFNDDRKAERVFWLLALVAAAVLVAVVLSGCVSTVSPPVVASSSASWDGTVQNSGLVGTNSDGLFLFTEHARQRYAGLCALYRTNFVPPIDPGRGVTNVAPGLWLFDAEAVERFVDMSRWRRNGR